MGWIRYKNQACASFVPVVLLGGVDAYAQGSGASFHELDGLRFAGDGTRAVGDQTNRARLAGKDWQQRLRAHAGVLLYVEHYCRDEDDEHLHWAIYSSHAPPSCLGGGLRGNVCRNIMSFIGP